MSNRIFTQALTLMLFTLASAAFADDGGADDSVLPEQLQTGSLLLQMQHGYETATRINTKVDIRISGPVARTVVRQVFRNDGAGWVEAIYVFPLPDSAAVDRLRIRAGERLVEGEIREKEQARKDYAQARENGQRAGLVEQQRANLFTTSIANVGPGETLVVELEYLEVLEYDDGAFSLRFPLTLTPRYIPGEPLPGRQGSGWSFDSGSVPDASQITPPVVGRSNDHNVTLRVEIDAGVPLQVIASRYHAVDVTPVDEERGRYSVALKNPRVHMDHDLELVWRPVADAMPRAALFRESRGEAMHYLMLMLPPTRMTEGEAGTVTVPRELLFVIDTSGSMHGTSIEQAKTALMLALKGLAPNDRFEIIQFNSRTHSLFGKSVSASADNVETARRYVQGLSANGGTEMRPALERVLGLEARETHLRQIIFITDGSVGNEAELFSMIEANISGARLFTVGIGSAPNSWFMRKAAEAGRGSYTFISALHEVREKMERLFRKLERPQITGIRVEWPGGALAYPETVPDLYAGEPVLQRVRLSQPPRPGDLVRVSGSSPSGGWDLELPAATEQEHAGVAAVWARARIEHLLDLGRRQEDPDAVREAVVETALEHHLLSPYTSLVAIDKTPLRPKGSPLATEPLPNLLPYGQSQRAIFGFPATAAGWSRQMAMGAAMLLLCALLVFSRFGPMAPMGGRNNARV